MANQQFKNSQSLTLGIELELQLLNPETFDLIDCSDAILSALKPSSSQNSGFWAWKPELIQSMIELNTTVHHNVHSLFTELKQARQQLQTACSIHNVKVCGGGAHPFHAWRDSQIYPNTRYEKLYQTYGYLTKLYSVFAEHIHIGCDNPEDAIYLSHALSRFIPQFIALSGSSPFYQSMDAHYCSTRANIINKFPLSSVMPYLANWSEFCDYFAEMQTLGIVESMKDFYWDIRPKPEYGTVEIRICDTPLNIRRAASLAAYAQAIAKYLLSERPIGISEKLYLPYAYNRFQAARYGLDGHFIDPINHQKRSIAQDILSTLVKIAPYAKALDSSDYILDIEHQCQSDISDSSLLRSFYQKIHSLPDLVKFMSDNWDSNL